MSCQQCQDLGQICFVRGEDVLMEFDLMGAGVLGGAAEVLFTAKRYIDDDVTDSKAVLKAVGVIDSLDQFHIELSSSETAAIQPGRYCWDTRITDQDGKVTYTIPSDLTVHQPVTNRSTP